VLVTGATGIGRLLADSAAWWKPAPMSCAWCADWVPQSELLRSGTLDRVKVVRGDLRDREVLERAIGEVRNRHRNPPGGTGHRRYRHLIPSPPSKATSRAALERAEAWPPLRA